MASESKKWLKIRMGIILTMFLVLFIALISRAFQLQVLSGKKLKTLAQRQHTTVLQLPPERGVIYDRNGEKLAVSIMADSVCADPSKIADPARASGQVAEILNLDNQAVFKKISTPKSFCWLARKISPEQAVSVGKCRHRRNFSSQRAETLLSQWRIGRAFAGICRHGCRRVGRIGK